MPQKMIWCITRMRDKAGSEGPKPMGKKLSINSRLLGPGKPKRKKFKIPDTLPSTVNIRRVVEFKIYKAVMTKTTSSVDFVKSLSEIYTGTEEDMNAWIKSREQFYNSLVPGYQTNLGEIQICP